MSGNWNGHEPEEKPYREGSTMLIKGWLIKGWFSQCRCGWQGPERDTKNAAEDDSVAHRIAMDDD